MSWSFPNNDKHAPGFSIKNRIWNFCGMFTEIEIGACEMVGIKVTDGEMQDGTEVDVEIEADFSLSFDDARTLASMLLTICDAHDRADEHLLEAMERDERKRGLYALRRKRKDRS